MRRLRKARAAAAAARRTCSARSGAPAVPSAGRASGPAEPDGEQQRRRDRAAGRQLDDLLGRARGPGEREQRRELAAERRVEAVRADQDRRRRRRVVLGVASEARPGPDDEDVDVGRVGRVVAEPEVGRGAHGACLHAGLAASPPDAVIGMLGRAPTLRAVRCPTRERPGHALRHSPLHARHEALGATFAAVRRLGDARPVRGSRDRARAVSPSTPPPARPWGSSTSATWARSAISGPGAAAFVDRCLTNDLSRIVPGKAQYTLCCAEDGGVVDDLILYLVGDDEVFAVPNAANSAGVGQLPRGGRARRHHRGRRARRARRPRRPGPARRAEVLDRGGRPARTWRDDLDYMAFVDVDRADRPSGSAAPATPASTATS